MYYFTSDIHLGAGGEQFSRENEHRFVAWLDLVAKDAEAIFLVGDVFDYWFEYRRVVPKGFVRTLGKLAELTDRGIRVVFFTGNHDMWVGDYLARECGVEIYTSPQELCLGGKQVFIAHGDNLKIDGQPVLKFLNTLFRSRALRWFFSWTVHPDWMTRFGRWWSGKSRKSHKSEALDPSFTEPLIGYAREYATKHKVDYFVFGHMHFPRDFNERGLRVINLGWWERDPSYAVLDDSGGMTLKLLEK